MDGVLTRVRIRVPGDRAATPGRVPWPAVLAAQLVGAAFALMLYRFFGRDFDQFDLRIYRSAITYWLDGRGGLYDYSQLDSVNGQLGFTYPPFAAVLLAPLAELALTPAIAVSFAITLLSNSALVYLILRVRRNLDRRTLLVGTAVLSGVSMLLEPIEQQLAFGQINLLLALLVAVDVLVLGPSRSRWHGVGIGIAMAIKLTPGIFLLYLLLARRWAAAARAVGAATAATAIAGVIAPRETLRFFTETLWQTARVGPQENVTNQSLGGMLARIAAPHETPTWWWLLAVVAALVIGGLRVRASLAAGDLLAGLALVGMVGVLVSPVSWIHHSVWALPALVVCLQDVVFRFRPAAPGWWRSVLLLLSGAFVWVFSARKLFQLPDLGYGGAGFWMLAAAGLQVMWMVLAVALLPVTRCTRDVEPERTSR